MPYRYVAYTDKMKLTNGVVSSASESQAEEELRQLGYTVVSLKPAGAGPSPSLQRFLPQLSAVKDQDVIALSRQLATMIDAGVSLLPALQLLQEQSTNSALTKVISAVVEDLQAGTPFSQAIEKHPQVFKYFYVQMIRSGEQAGNLEVVLRQVASYMDKEKALMKKAGKAMIYPCFILAIAFGVVFLMVNVALPSMIEMFTGFKAELPMPTKILVAITNFSTGYRLQLFAGTFIVVAGVGWYVKQPFGRLKLDELLLKAPVLGKITLLQEMTRFSRTMSMLLHAGLPSTDIMNIVVPTCKNGIIRGSLKNLQEEMLRGHGLSQPLAADRLFPRLLVQMVTVGEETGTLDTTLEALANSYEADVDDKVTKLISLMEPALTLIIGVIVGFIVISMIMPMYSIMNYVG